MAAGWRQYQPGWCQNPNCQKDLGLAEQFGGRDRKYCNDNCRKQAFRYREKIERGYQMAQQAKLELLGGYQLDDKVLREIAKLADYGPGAIRTGVEIAIFISNGYREKAEKRGICL
jgi:hypothetical protein